MSLTPERIAAATKVARELEQLQRDGFAPINTQERMATILALVQDKRCSVAAALVLIERWGDDFVRRQIEAIHQKRVDNAKPALDA